MKENCDRIVLTVILTILFLFFITSLCHEGLSANPCVPETTSQSMTWKPVRSTLCMDTNVSTRNDALDFSKLSTNLKATTKTVSFSLLTCIILLATILSPLLSHYNIMNPLIYDQRCSGLLCIVEFIQKSDGKKGNLVSYTEDK